MFFKKYGKVFFRLIIILALSFPFHLIAQDSTSFKRYAIQFQITENFQLKEFQGAFISGKYHFTKAHALRFGFTIGIDSKELTTEQKYVNDSWEENLNNNTKEYLFQINTQYIYYNDILDGVSLFLGTGPFLGYEYGESIRLTQTNPGRNELTNTDWSIGLKVIVGMEYFIISNLSFLAEYSPWFGYTYSKSEVKNGDISASRSILDGIELSAEEVKFGLSVYF
jgi:opacity protein-like surface antigen